ncbi:Remorin [Vigna unguiculata]|uniref:Remorin n=2 Tax=Vigna unguiculata TaxID=3917 RepID=A0A4D6LQE4_VIGUN|nr:Remorin [Vigna unguiculata]
MRVPFSGTEESKSGHGGTKDSKISIQKTQSFKGENKGAQNWFQKQFARKRSGDHESRDMDHAAAVAAAAFAINLLDVSEGKKETPKALLEKTKNRVDGTKPQIPLLSSASKRLSGSFRLKDEQGKKPEEAILPAPSMKKTSTFSDEKPETLTKPETSTKPDLGRQPTLGESFERHAKADEWERTELQDIRQRYDKLTERIDSWANKKRIKARRKLNQEERVIAKRRMRALEDFQNRITSIDHIADRARTSAEESRKNEVNKAKAKANVIRSTGKMPAICFCF